MTQEMCRICLTTSNLAPLFSGLHEDKKFGEFLSLLTGLDIKSQDKLPQSICFSCRMCVENASILRKTSQRSHQRLLAAGFGKTTECPMFEVDIVKSEHDYEDPVFSDSCDGLPIKTEKETNQQQEVKKENKNIETNIKTNSIQKKKSVQKKNQTKNSVQKKNSVQTKNSLIKESSVQEKGVQKEKSVQNDRFKFGSRENTRKMYLNLVKGKFDPAGPVQCRICNKIVSKWTCFTSHVKIHLDTKFVCEHCGKKFTTRGHMNRHCRSQHGMEKVLICPYCPFKAIDTTLLKHHTRREHTGERPYICDYCSASYFSRRCLIQHIDSHLTTSTVQCEQCSQFFKSRRHLSRHKFQVHTCKLFTYQCPVCKQIYKSVKYVRIHMRKVHSLSARDHKIIKTKL